MLVEAFTTATGIAPQVNGQRERLLTALDRWTWRDDFDAVEAIYRERAAAAIGAQLFKASNLPDLATADGCDRLVAYKLPRGYTPPSTGAPTESIFAHMRNPLEPI